MGGKLRVAALSVLGDEAGAAEDAAVRSLELPNGTAVLCEDLCCLPLNEQRFAIFESVLDQDSVFGTGGLSNVGDRLCSITIAV